MINNNQNTPKIETDLNDRERVKFAKLFRELAKTAEIIFTALENGDDTEMIKNFVFFNIAQMGTRDLQEIILKAVVKSNKTQNDDENFPSFIYPIILI